MKLGAFTRTLLAVSGFWMMGYGLYGMSLESKVVLPGATRNVLVENVRSRNAQTLGLGVMVLALSAVGANPVGRVCDKVESTGVWVTEKVTGKPAG